MVSEKPYRPITGWLTLIVCIGLLIAGPWLVIAGAIGLGHYGEGRPLLQLVGGILLIFIGFICLFGFMAIAPNQARVLLLFGVYKGSALESGFFWVNPFFSKRKISLRIRNFETGSTHTPEQKTAEGKVIQKASRTHGRPSKVNDRDGNPIEISAVVVWRVVNTAEAMFEVDDFEDFVAVQSEAALRNLASRHPYDSEDHELSLRGSTAEISEQLEADIQERLDKAGVEVI
jgi:regulator of protease activity HflC (stomatin/prohibitin superfamily)